MDSPTLATRMETGECELIMDRLMSFMTCSRPLCLLTRVDHLKLDLTSTRIISTLLSVPVKKNAMLLEIVEFLFQQS